MQEMDGLKTSSKDMNVIVIGATNRFVVNQAGVNIFLFQPTIVGLLTLMMLFSVVYLDVCWWIYLVKRNGRVCAYCGDVYDQV